jgi:hypothetical protein
MEQLDTTMEEGLEGMFALTNNGVPDDFLFDIDTAGLNAILLDDAVETLPKQPTIGQLKPASLVEPGATLNYQKSPGRPGEDNNNPNTIRISR